jgi:hypothetical protein
MSPMKPTAHTTASKVMPINAKNAAFLRVMAGVYTLPLPCRQLPQFRRKITAAVAKGY